MKNEAEERRGSPPATAADLSFPSSTWMERDLRDGRMKRRAPPFARRTRTSVFFTYFPLTLTMTECLDPSTKDPPSAAATATRRPSAPA